MIKLLRIDDRLLHGQVAFYWMEFLKLKSIIIVNDEAANDDFTKMILELAKPKELELHVLEMKECKEVLIEKSRSNDNSIVIVNSTFDSNLVASILDSKVDINIGGLRNRPNSMKITEYCYLTNEDISTIKKLISSGFRVNVARVPSDQEILMEDVLID